MVDVVRALLWVLLVLLSCWVVAKVVLTLVPALHRWIERHWPTPPKDWRDEYAPKCGACGFDLRESVDRCPECGMEMSGYDRAVSWQLQRLRDVESPMTHLHTTAGRHGEIAAVKRIRG